MFEALGLPMYRKKFEGKTRCIASSMRMTLFCDALAFSSYPPNASFYVWGLTGVYLCNIL